MVKPKIVLFDWKESPAAVITDLAKAVNEWSGPERPVITRVTDTGEDSEIAILSDRKLTQTECHQILDAAIEKIN